MPIKKPSVVSLPTSIPREHTSSTVPQLPALKPAASVPTPAIGGAMKSPGMVVSKPKGTTVAAPKAPKVSNRIKEINGM